MLISISAATVLCVIVVMAALRIYRPQVRINRYTGWVGVGLIVCLLAGIQVTASYDSRSIEMSHASELYMLADSLGQDSSLQSLQLIKRAWEEQPSTDRKWLLGLAYLNDGQTERAYRLLQEAAEEAKEADWFKAEQVNELLEIVERYEAELSRIVDQAVSRGTSSMKPGDAIGETSDVQIAVANGARISAEMVQATAMQGLTDETPAAESDAMADADMQESSDASGSDVTEVEEAADMIEVDEYTFSDSMMEWFEPLDLEEEEEETHVYDEALSAQLSAIMEEALAVYRGMIQEAVQRLQEQAAKQADMPQEELAWLAKLAIERLRFADAVGDDSWRYVYEAAIEAAADGAIESPVLLRELAGAAIYLSDDYRAERILIQIVRDYPEDEESVAMLSELYLSGRVKPGEEARQLPQYPFAEQRAEQEWLEQQREQAQELEQLESGFTDSLIGRAEDRIPDELAYAILEPLVDEDSSYKLDARLSRYYFNTGDMEKAAELIESMSKKTDQMSIGEQRSMQQLEQQSELTGEDILDEAKRQSQIQAREDVYRALHAPRQSYDPTIEDSSFAYYMQEQLRLEARKSIVITSVDADEDSGQVVMYVRVENVDELTKGSLSLTDNGKKISDFKLEKIGQAEYHSRAIGVVIDVSGSMAGDRIEAAKTATGQFMANLKSFERAELVAFDDSPHLVQEMTNNISALQVAVSSLEAGGGTNITSALQSELERIASQSGQRVVIIFTDGEDSEFSLPESRARIIALANNIGTPVFAVGFGAGYDTLSEVATATGGQFIAAANTAAIMSGFADVAKTLERTYTITYTLEPMEDGLHRVELMMGEMAAEDEYWIGEQARLGDSFGEDEVDKIETDNRYLIQQVLPGTVQLDQSAGASVTLEGLGLDQTEKLYLGKLKMDYKVKDGNLQFKLPRDLKEGKYTITARARDGRTTEADLTVLEPGMEQSVRFGWATVYGRWIEAKGQEVRITGNPSVDHFLYTSGSSDEMVLRNGTELSFQGFHVAVDKTQIPLLGQAAMNVQQASDRLIHPKMTMKLLNHGEMFNVAYGGASKLTLRRMGLEFTVSTMNYYALRGNGAGRLEAKIGLSGWNTATKAAANVKLLQSIKFPYIPDATVLATFYPNNLAIKGDVTLESVGYQTMFKADNVSLGVEYEFRTGRLLLSGGFSQIEVLGRPLSAGPIKGGKITLGWENGMVPKAYGVTVTGNGIPLGATGLTVNKFGLLLDFTNARTGNLEIGLGTVVDKVRPFLEKLNRISILGYKPFDFDPDKVTLLSLGANVGVKYFLTSDWEASGNMTAKLFGFNVADRSFRVNRNLMEFGAKFDIVLLVDGKLAIIYSNPSKSNHLTVGQNGKVTGPFIDLKMQWIVVPARISDSAYAFTGKAGGFDVDLKMGVLNVYK
jgi:Mg-chelatase subunit ChlD